MADNANSQPTQVDSDIESTAGRSAPEDPILAERLGAPSDPIAIYLEEASPYRPIVTGDVFQGVAVPGSTEDETAHDLTMVIAHPSAMRRGAELEPRARAAPIAPVDGLRRTAWSHGHYNVFPLPLLRQVAEQNGFRIENRGWGVLLELAAPIQTAHLDVTRRVACLAPLGIQLLLQRLVHADTRFPVRDDLIASVFSPKLEEIEMLQSWNEELVAPLVDQGGDLNAALRSAARDFEDTLNAPELGNGTPIRTFMERPTGIGQARRLLTAQIIRRRRELTTPD